MYFYPLTKGGVIDLLTKPKSQTAYNENKVGDHTSGIVEFVFLIRGPGDSSIIKFNILPICISFVVFRLESDVVVEKAIGDGSARHDCFTPLITTLLSATLIPSSVP